MFTSTKRSADRSTRARSQGGAQLAALAELTLGSTRARSQGGAQLAALAELTLGYFGKPLRGKEV